MRDQGSSQILRWIVETIYHAIRDGKFQLSSENGVVSSQLTTKNGAKINFETPLSTLIDALKNRLITKDDSRRQ